MDTANTVLIEVDGQRDKELALRTPRTIGELWDMFTKLGQHPASIALPFGKRTAIVNF